jgi:oligo-1,6-glucosidase
VVLNFSQDEAVFKHPENLHYKSAELLIGNYPVDPDGDIREFSLRPYEARVYRIS